MPPAIGTWVAITLEQSTEFIVAFLYGSSTHEKTLTLAVPVLRPVNRIAGGRRSLSSASYLAHAWILINGLVLLVSQQGGKEKCGVSTGLCLRLTRISQKASQSNYQRSIPSVTIMLADRETAMRIGLAGTRFSKNGTCNWNSLTGWKTRKAFTSQLLPAVIGLGLTAGRTNLTGSSRLSTSKIALCLPSYWNFSWHTVILAGTVRRPRIQRPQSYQLADSK